MRIIFLAHVSSLSLGWARLADPNSEMRNQKCQKPVELNKYFDSRQGKGQDKDRRQNKGQLTGGATRPQIAINMPEIGIQKMRSERTSCNWVQRGGQTGAIYVKIVVLKTWEIAIVRAGGGQGVWARKTFEKTKRKSPQRETIQNQVARLEIPLSYCAINFSLIYSIDRIWE